MKSIAARTANWNGNTISLPNELVNDYRNQLSSLGRLNDAQGESPKGEIGGESEEDTHQHFIHRFGASAARTSFLILDPHDEIGGISSELRDSFTDGQISVLDIPCGTGASILGFLGCIYQLRKEKLITTLPLDVYITAGDISEHALKIYNDMAEQAQHWLQNEGIRIHWDCHKWDITDHGSTASLIDNWFSQSKSEEWIVMIAAFSGFLAGKKSDFDENKRFVQHICERMHNRLGSITWIEPISNDSQWIFNKIENLGSWGRWAVRFFKIGFSFKWIHPIKLVAYNGGLRVFHNKRTNNV